MVRNMDVADLKPCPFCGGKAELVHSDYKMHDIKIRCTRCYIETGWYTGEVTELSEQWNTRVSPKTVTVKLPAHCGDLSDI